MAIDIKPLTDLSVNSQTVANTVLDYVTVTLNITGSSSTQTEYTDNAVYTMYRYKIGDGDWSGSGAVSNTPAPASTTVNPKIRGIGYNQTVQVEAWQCVYGKLGKEIKSEVKSLTFTSAGPVRPTGKSITVVSRTWNSVTLKGTCDYGTPNSIDGRKMAIGVASSLERTAKRENQPANSTTATTTVTNSSIYPRATALTLKGCLKVYPYVWAHNGAISTQDSKGGANNGADGYDKWDTAGFYLPPAPLEVLEVVSQSATGQSNGTAATVIRVQGSKADNVDDAKVFTSWRYRFDGDIVWHGWYYTTTSASPDTVVERTLYLPYGTTVILQARQSSDGYTGALSEVKTLTFNVISLAKTYIPLAIWGLPNSPIYQSQFAEKFYISVDGKSKLVDKLYTSVDGKTKLIYRAPGVT